MQLRSVLPVQLRPATLVATVEHEGQEWCLIRESCGAKYWTPYRGGMLVPAAYTTGYWGDAKGELPELVAALADAPSSGKRR